MRRSKKLQIPVIGLAIIVVVLGIVTFGIYLHHSRATAVQSTSTPTPSPGSPGNPGDTAKENLSSAEPSLSPVANPGANAQPAFIDSFSVQAVTGGWHVVTILSGLASGSCKLTITPTNSGALTKSGSVIVSGNTYMCDFGGSVPGSGAAGTAGLVVTSSSGQSDNMSISYQ